MSPPKFNPLFISNEQHKFFESLPENKQKAIIKLANGDQVKMNRMLMDQYEPAFSLKYNIGDNLKTLYALPLATQFHIIKVTNKNFNKIMDILEDPIATKQMLNETGYTYKD
jgi:hypothetical protein